MEIFFAENSRLSATVLAFLFKSSIILSSSKRIWIILNIVKTTETTIKIGKINSKTRFILFFLFSVEIYLPTAGMEEVASMKKIYRKIEKKANGKISCLELS